MKTRVISGLCMLLAVSMMAQAPQNLLKNPSFESKDAKNETVPSDWGIFCEKGDPTAFALVTETPKEGASAFKIGFDNLGSKFYGIGQRIPVKAGQMVTYSANIRNKSLRDESYVQISIEWVNGDEPKKEISRTWGPQSKAVDLTTDGWKKFEVTAMAPPGAVEANIVVTLFPAGSPDGAVLLDDFSVTVKDAPTK